MGFGAGGGVKGSGARVDTAAEIGDALNHGRVAGLFCKIDHEELRSEDIVLCKEKKGLG